MTAAQQSAPLSEALHTDLTHACSAGTRARTDCGKKRDPRGDDPKMLTNDEQELDMPARLKKQSFTLNGWS